MFVRTSIWGKDGRRSEGRELEAELLFAWGGWGMIGVRTDVRALWR